MKAHTLTDYERDKIVEETAEIYKYLSGNAHDGTQKHLTIFIANDTVTYEIYKRNVDVRRVDTLMSTHTSLREAINAYNEV